jgi:hypothetical protein
MHVVLITLAVLSSAVTSASNLDDAAGVQLSTTMEKRSASLLGGLELDATWRPSAMAPLRETDGLRFMSESPRALDAGGGVDSDVRQILALILGFIPGFGIGHLIAQDRDGFILFLIIDIAIYAVWGALWFNFYGWIGPIGGIVWLVVHIIQALDAYAEAGGGRIVERTRERAVGIASAAADPISAPVTTTRLFALQF